VASTHAKQEVIGVSDFRTEQEVGAYVRDLRKRAGDTQADLAEVLGVEQPTISKIEAGSRALTGRELMLIADRYATTSSSIVRNEAAAAVLRAGDAEPESVHASLKLFRDKIERYFGLRVLAT
jgi:transcriptional regulator with XRE-family HTH domain